MINQLTILGHLGQNADCQARTTEPHHQVQRCNEEILEGRKQRVAGEEPVAPSSFYMESKVLVNSQFFLKPVGCEKRVWLRK